MRSEKKFPFGSACRENVSTWTVHDHGSIVQYRIVLSWILPSRIAMFEISKDRRNHLYHHDANRYHQEIGSVERDVAIVEIEIHL